MTILVILTPRPGTLASVIIDPESGIVVRAEAWTAATVRGADGGTVEVYYEGNRCSIPQLASLPARIAHAADRLLHHYPTIARGRFVASDFEAVGTYAVRDDGWTDLIWGMP